MTLTQQSLKMRLQKMNKSHVSSQRLNLNYCPIRSSEGLFDNIKSKKYDFWNEETFEKWISSNKSLFGKICNLCIRIQKDKSLQFANNIRYGNYTALDYDYGKTFISSSYIEKILRGIYSKDFKRKKDDKFPTIMMYMDLSTVHAPQKTKNNAINSFFNKYKETINNYEFKTDWEKCGNAYWDQIERAVKNNEEACGFCIYI